MNCNQAVQLRIQEAIQLQCKMTSRSLLVTVFVVMSCVALSTCNRYNNTILTYSPRVLNSTSQDGCPPDTQLETVREEVKEDIRNLLQHVRVYNDCKDALTQGQTTSGVYTIQPDSQPTFQVYCDMETDGGGWTVFQRRMDGSVDFYRYWTDYQQGFGNLSGEFWLGLDKIHRLTSTATELRVDLQDFEGNSTYAQYTSFSIGDSASKYILSVSRYDHGTAGDSLINADRNHHGSRFTTRDQDNDAAVGVNCAQSYNGAWWYLNCYSAHLNGPYFTVPQTSNRGIIWSTWRGYNYSLKFTEMKLREY